MKLTFIGAAHEVTGSCSLLFCGVPLPLFTFLYYYKTFLLNPQQDLLSGITFQKIESFIIVSLSLLC